MRHCCSTSDCQGSLTGETFFCGKYLFGLGDMDACLLNTSPGAGLQGAACANNNQCASGLCNTVCRERCCTDADCASPSFPRCGLEPFTFYGTTRLLNVCVP